MPLLTAFCLFAVFGTVSIVVGLVSDVLTWAPTAKGLARNAAVILVIPALAEEAIFRGPLLRWPTVPVAVILGTAYVLWHPFAAWAFLPETAAVFFDPAFLLITTMFAALATILTIRHRTLWPATACHFAMVLAWKQLFGGPIIVGAF